MHKTYSTKRPIPVPDGFVDAFVTGGWAKVNLMYGKRCSVRNFKALGPADLRQRRLAYLAENRQPKSKPVPPPSTGSSKKAKRIKIAPLPCFISWPRSRNDRSR